MVFFINYLHAYLIQFVKIKIYHQFYSVNILFMIKLNSNLEIMLSQNSAADLMFTFIQYLLLYHHQLLTFSMVYLLLFIVVTLIVLIVDLKFRDLMQANFVILFETHFHQCLTIFSYFGRFVNLLGSLRLHKIFKYFCSLPSLSTLSEISLPDFTLYFCYFIVEK